jgi:hypothetical protein
MKGQAFLKTAIRRRPEGQPIGLLLCVRRGFAHPSPESVSQMSGDSSLELGSDVRRQYLQADKGCLVGLSGQL